MPRDDDEVKVLVTTLAVPNGETQAVPVEMGALGDAVELIAIHYSHSGWSATTLNALTVALSSNPSHLLNPPATAILLLGDPALYGLYSKYYAVTGTGVSDTSETKIIPLYSLIRPRRQILCALWEQAGIPVLRAEIYYRPVSLGKNALNLMNRKYGKYRRT